MGGLWTALTTHLVGLVYIFRTLLLGQSQTVSENFIWEIKNKEDVTGKIK